MSEENVEVARRVFELAQEGLRTGDHRAAFERGVKEGILAPDLVWRAGVRRGVGIVGLSDTRGATGYIEFIQSWTEDFEDYEMTVEEIIDAGAGRVAAVIRQGARGKGSGAPVEAVFGMILHVESKCVVRADVFADAPGALKAAGLAG